MKAASVVGGASKSAYRFACPGDGQRCVGGLVIFFGEMHATECHMVFLSPESGAA